MLRRSDPKNVRQIIAFSLTVAAAMMVLLVPLYSGVKVTNDGPEHVTTSTLLDIVGLPILVPLLIPVALTGLPLLLRERPQKYASVATTVALAIFALLASATIGWFYVPALAAALASVLASSRQPLNNSGPSFTAGQP
ncbi:MAG: hypothetical protein QOH40_2517 [Arthrobacter pascens]|nr:hypothetical protein [Arthrobacter pascens]